MSRFLVAASAEESLRDCRIVRQRLAWKIGNCGFPHPVELERDRRQIISPRHMAHTVRIGMR